MVKSIKIKEHKPIELYLFGDIHIGAKTCKKKEFEQTLKMIQKDPRARWIGMGDYIEAIEKDDVRRFNPHNVDPKLNTAYKQALYIQNKFKKLRKKSYGILTGNHEIAYAKYHKELFEKYRDPAEKIAIKSGITFLEDLGIIELTIKKHKYNIVVAHGAGSSSKLAGQVNALNNIINSYEVVPDIAAMGHCHALQAIVNPKMNFKFQTKIKHFALTGSYYGTYNDGNMNYASNMLYNPLPIGCIKYSLDTKGNIKDNKIIF